MELFKWNKKLDDRLIAVYPNSSTIGVANEFGTSVDSIQCRAYRLDLKKDSDFLKKLRCNVLTLRNKTMGRDLTDELLGKIALKYKTRGEFQHGDPSAYSTAINRDIIDDICKHMTIMKFSIPQLILRDIMDGLLGVRSMYNTRKIIKPYEIDVYYPSLKLGFEYQGKAWHEDKYNNGRDLLKVDLLNEKGITIIYIVENNRRYEEDIKNQLIKQLPLINKIAKKQLTEDDVVNHIVGNIYLELYNKADLIQIAKQYTSFKVFIKKEKKVRYKLWKMKLLDEATSHMTDRVIKHTEEEVKEKLKKYVNLGDLIKHDKGIYLYIKRNKLNHLIKHLVSKNERFDFTIEQIVCKINNYSRKCDFIRENKRMYSYLNHNKLTHLMRCLINCNRFDPVNKLSK